MNAGQKRTELIVCAAIGACLVWLIYYLTDPFWTRVLSAALVVEAATLMDRYRSNTISEAIWRLNSRPIVPHLFGIAMGWAIGAGRLDPLTYGVGFLMGHFFFQAHQDDVKTSARAERDVALVYRDGKVTLEPCAPNAATTYTPVPTTGAR